MPDRPNIPAAPIRDSHMPPDDHMPAVGIALIVCLPLGLVALAHSRRITRYWQEGNRLGARRASQAAWAWCFRAMMIPALLFGLFITYWGWIALREDFRPYVANTELYELLYGRNFADEDGGEDEAPCDEEEEEEEEE